MCRKRPFATYERGRRQTRTSVCRIPCRILCLADVERMHAEKRKQLTGRGGADKTVAGVKDRVRASVVERVDGPTLTGFVEGHAAPEAIVYTDEATAYTTLANRHAVKHGVGEWVRDQIHINGMESFWSMLKRAHMGTFHKLSPKHLDRYVQEFAGKHNMRNSGTLTQMQRTAARLVGRSLLYRDLVADNGSQLGRIISDSVRFWRMATKRSALMNVHLRPKLLNQAPLDQAPRHRPVFPPCVDVRCTQSHASNHLS